MGKKNTIYSKVLANSVPSKQKKINEFGFKLRLKVLVDFSNTCVLTPQKTNTTKNDLFSFYQDNVKYRNLYNSELLSDIF